jgi:hypothetical protein
MTAELLHHQHEYDRRRCAHTLVCSQPPTTAAQKACHAPDSTSHHHARTYTQCICIKPANTVAAPVCSCLPSMCTNHKGSQQMIRPYHASLCSTAQPCPASSCHALNLMRRKQVLHSARSQTTTASHICTKWQVRVLARRAQRIPRTPSSLQCNTTPACLTAAAAAALHSCARWQVLILYGRRRVAHQRLELPVECGIIRVGRLRGHKLRRWRRPYR